MKYIILTGKFKLNYQPF